MRKILERNQIEVNKQLELIFPRAVRESWVKNIVGPGSYDLDAINKFFAIPMWDFLDRGGKRWRPLLMLLSCDAVGGNSSKYHKFTIVPELIHNATLIADDIEDSSLTRRGKPALHLKFGTDIAINLGDALFFLPLLTIRDSKLSDATKVALYEVINTELLRLHFGQGTDIYWHREVKTTVTEKQYFTMCANKTGTLARLAAKMGAILGRGSRNQIFLLGKFAESIGIAFQIQDDILNIQGSVGKQYGDDITEGKLSLPALHSLKHASNPNRAKLRAILAKHTRNTKEINTAINIIKSTGSIEYSRAKANEIVKIAWETLEPSLKSSKSKLNLEGISKFMVDRKA